MDNLDYDKILILEPYTIINKVEQELNIDLSNISENKIHLSDGINLLVFIKDNQSVNIVELPRINGDFECYNILIDRKNAIFEKIGSAK